MSFTLKNSLIPNSKGLRYLHKVKILLKLIVIYYIYKIYREITATIAVVLMLAII